MNSDYRVIKASIEWKNEYRVEKASIERKKRVEKATENSE